MAIDTRLSPPFASAAVHFSRRRVPRQAAAARWLQRRVARALREARDQARIPRKRRLRMRGRGLVTTLLRTQRRGTDLGAAAVFPARP